MYTCNACPFTTVNEPTAIIHDALIGHYTHKDR